MQSTQHSCGTFMKSSPKDQASPIAWFLWLMTLSIGVRTVLQVGVIIRCWKQLCFFVENSHRAHVTHAHESSSSQTISFTKVAPSCRKPSILSGFSFDHSRADTCCSVLFKPTEDVSAECSDAEPDSPDAESEGSPGDIQSVYSTIIRQQHLVTNLFVGLHPYTPIDFSLLGYRPDWLKPHKHQYYVFNKPQHTYYTWLHSQLCRIHSWNYFNCHPKATGSLKRGH